MAEQINIFLQNFKYMFLNQNNTLNTNHYEPIDYYNLYINMRDFLIDNDIFLPDEIKDIETIPTPSLPAGKELIKNAEALVVFTFSTSMFYTFTNRPDKSFKYALNAFSYIEELVNEYNADENNLNKLPSCRQVFEMISKIYAKYDYEIYAVDNYDPCNNNKDDNDDKDSVDNKFSYINDSRSSEAEEKNKLEGFKGFKRISQYSNPKCSITLDSTPKQIYYICKLYDEHPLNGTDYNIYLFTYSKYYDHYIFYKIKQSSIDLLEDSARTFQHMKYNYIYAVSSNKPRIFQIIDDRIKFLFNRLYYNRDVITKFKYEDLINQLKSYNIISKLFKLTQFLIKNDYFNVNDHLEHSGEHKLVLENMYFEFDPNVIPEYTNNVIPNPYFVNLFNKMGLNKTNVPIPDTNLHKHKCEEIERDDNMDSANDDSNKNKKEAETIYASSAQYNQKAKI